MKQLWKGFLATVGGFFAPGQSGKKGVLLILLFTLISKSMGFLREILMAYFYGAGPAVDAFVASYTIFTLAVLLPSSLLPVVGTPILVEQGIKEGQEGQNETFASLLSLWLIISVGLIAILAVFGPLLVRVVAPLLPPDIHALAVRIFYILLPMSLGMVLVHLATAYYNARRSFALPQTSGIILNTFIIFFLFLAQT
ncbi:MAG: lipid II flippase MurJ, partial [Candidatus Hydrothermia bacterium]